MKVVWLGKSDDSGTSNRIARAVNRVAGDIEMRCISARRSRCKYDEDVVIERDGKGRAWEVIKGADWIIQLGDNDYSNFFDMLDYLKVVDRGSNAAMSLRCRKQLGIKLGVRYAGTLYRTKTELYERMDAKVEWRRRWFPCDLYRMVKDDPNARVFVQPQGDHTPRQGRRLGGPLRVCHTPSHMDKKRSDLVHRAVDSVSGLHYALLTGLSYASLNRARSDFDVVIDHMNSDHGCFGAAAMEALYQGKVVISDWAFAHDTPEVDSLIPRPPILLARNWTQLAYWLEFLKDPEIYEHHQRRSLEWATRYLSDDFTYKYWAHCFDLGEEKESWDPLTA